MSAHLATMSTLCFEWGRAWGFCIIHQWSRSCVVCCSGRSHGFACTAWMIRCIAWGYHLLGWVQTGEPKSLFMGEPISYIIPFIFQKFPNRAYSWEKNLIKNAWAGAADDSSSTLVWNCGLRYRQLQILLASSNVKWCK